MKMKTFNIAAIVFLGATMASCNHNFDRIPVHENPRWEYAPNMYHSEAYEPVSQVTDSASYPESYNTMPYNKGMNLRMPVAGTIKRGFMPYHISKDSIAWADQLTSPLTPTPQILEEGEDLYKKFCAHCHGEGGEGDGPVSEKLMGVANLKSAAIMTVTEGHIFHVITHGKGRMLQHASQLDPTERWKIAHYVKEVLQKQ